VTFSGGVSEYVFGRETVDHGDLGGDIAAGVTEALKVGRIPYPVYDPGQGIRATVVGASQFSVQVSGNTIHISRPDLLPIRNVPVIRLGLALDGEIDSDAVSEDIQKSFNRFDIDPKETATALAFTWDGEPAYQRLFALAKGIRDGYADTIAAGHAVILVMEGDVAKTMGNLLMKELDVPGDIISLDGVQLREFDYIDVGELVQPANVAPLIIKSLLFTADDRHGDDGHHQHDHDHSHEHDHEHHHHD